MMKKTLVASLCSIIAMALFYWAPDSGAYSTYDGCANCHRGFTDKPYTAFSDGQTWARGLHDVHKDMLNGDCETCHSASSRTPVYINKSAGGSGLDNISCIGCHGRAEDGSGMNNTWRYGAGLILKHLSSGVCFGCHTDSNPSNQSYMPPVGEHALPPYYANPGVNHPAMSVDPCNQNLSEDFAGTPVGLDNDGDGFYDGDDSDCVFLPFCTDADDDGFNADGGNCGPIDCDDTDFMINPDATEICENGIDENCDGADDSCPFDCTDYDNDGYGVGTDCLGPDCNDNDAAVNPGVAEKCDGIDNDCNSVIDDGFDVDGDGYTICSGDCNEGNPSINPDVSEVCDGVDNNCDGNIDEGFDSDGDGYTTCEGDCDDSSRSINPGSTEICGNGVDDNCDGVDEICPVADVMLNNLKAPATLRIGNRIVLKRILVFGSADIKVQEAVVQLSVNSTSAVTVNIHPESISQPIPIDVRNTKYLFNADMQCNSSGTHTIEWSAMISAPENRELNNDSTKAATTVICR